MEKSYYFFKSSKFQPNFIKMVIYNCKSHINNLLFILVGIKIKIFKIILLSYFLSRIGVSWIFDALIFIHSLSLPSQLLLFCGKLKPNICPNQSWVYDALNLNKYLPKLNIIFLSYPIKPDALLNLFTIYEWHNTIFESLIMIKKCSSENRS